VVDSPMRELVVCTARGAGDPPFALPGLVPVVDRCEAEGVVVDLPHGDPGARVRFGRHRPVDAVGWCTPGASLPAGLADRYDEWFRLRCTAHVGWRPAEGDEPDPLDVVKQVSFLVAADGYGEERFRAHYRHHVDVARRHMPALWQYVQNDVVDVSDGTEGAAGIVAVSELWFGSTDDFLHRYFPSEEDAEQLRAHEDFLDLTRASSFIATSHVAAPGARA